MTQLMQALLAEPGCAWEFSAVLPSGNVMYGSIGPVIGENVCAEIRFSVSPASEADKKQARELIDSALGGPATVEYDASGPGGMERARMAVRRSMGGGMG